MRCSLNRRGFLRFAPLASLARADRAGIAKRLVYVSRAMPASGGSALCNPVPGADDHDPFAISVGPAAFARIWPGWLNHPAAGRGREPWIDAAGVGASQAIAAQAQLQVFTNAVCVPLGHWFLTAAWRTTPTGQQKGPFALFWDIGCL